MVKPITAPNMLFGREPYSGTIISRSDVCIAGSELPAQVKRRATNSQGKPVLDEGTFQQLPTATYPLTTQEHNDRLSGNQPKSL